MYRRRAYRLHVSQSERDTGLDGKHTMYRESLWSFLEAIDDDLRRKERPSHGG